MKTVNAIPLIDTLQLSGPLTAYSIARSNAALTLFDKRTAGGVPISLVGVERLKFSDKDVAIDLDGHAGTVVKIIGAVIGSDFVKNPIYVGIGLGYLDKGMSYLDLCLLALKAMGASTTDAIVSLLWRNVVGFHATDEQKAPYIKMLADGMKPGDLAIFAADTDLNVRNIGLAVLKESGVEYTPANVDYTPPDTVRPSITISSNLSTLSIGEKAIITFTLSENSSNFTVGDVSVVGGVLSNFEGKDKNYTVTFTLLDNSTTGAIIYVAGSKFSDAAGNPNIASTQLNISVTSDSGDDGVPEPVPVDTSAPTLNSSTPADNATAVVVGNNIVLNFSETVTAGTGNFVITNGAADTRTIAVGDAQVTISGSTVTINPTADLLANSAYNIQMASGVLRDSAGNAYAGIANATTLNFFTPDTTAPTLSIGSNVATLKSGETATITLTFSEAVTGFTNADLSAIENGTLTDVVSTDGGITYTATFTPTANITDTTNVITLLKTGVADAAGNAGLGSTSSNNYAIDTLAPTVAMVVADAALSVGETSLVTFTFSEAVTGFTNADLSAIENGTLTAVVSTDGGITYTATFTPTANITDTTNVITLLKTGVADAAGNAGLGSTSSNNYAIDTLAPTVAMVVTDAALSVGETSLVTFTFSEVVTGFANADLSAIENGTLTAVVSTDGGITYTATFTPTANITDTTNVITLLLF